MIPELVAREVRETLLDYLRTTWALADPAVERALFDHLEGAERGIFRGPYLRTLLPFASAPAGAPSPLRVRPDYAPHAHQQAAWERLASGAHHEPEPTLITTGTGSGKTECFLYPLLDHCFRAWEAKQPGIKAIVLYPMNALASDQARRFAKAIEDHPDLQGRIRVGMYVGGEGQHREMGMDHVIDDSAQLLVRPPDILLTNYRMLDLLLLRPKDRALWSKNAPGTLRYVVLDEVHTYDGAQATDVACLLRRLADRLGATGDARFCPVATSATVSSTPIASSRSTGRHRDDAALLDFAGRLFNRAITREAVIGETRLSAVELAARYGEIATDALPSDAAALAPEPQEEVGALVARSARAWFGSADEDRLELGRRLMGHSLLRALLEVASERPISASDLDQALCHRHEGYAARNQVDREHLLSSLLALVSWAKRGAGGWSLPLVQVQVQLWVREVRRLLREVSTTPQFRWLDDRPGTDKPYALPGYACRECGHTGWIARRSDHSAQLDFDYGEVAKAYMARHAGVAYLHRDPHVLGDPALGDPALGGAEPGGAEQGVLEQTRDRFDPETGRVVAAGTPDASGVDRSFPIAVYQSLSNSTPRRDRRRCPACDGDDSLTMLASRGATLASVAIGHLYTTPLNTDRKLLAFSDSVQDASHRAGFFSGRTYRFSVRSAMMGALRDAGPAGLALDAVAPAMIARYRTALATEADGQKHGGEAAMIAAFWPRDLEPREAYQTYVHKLRERAEAQKRAARDGTALDEPPPEAPPALRAELDLRLGWEAVREMGLGARIGRTLENTGSSSVAIDHERFERAVEEVLRYLGEWHGEAAGIGEASVRQFIAGLCVRVRRRGGIVHELLRKYIESNGNQYLLSKEHSPLLSPLGGRTGRPRFLTQDPKSDAFDSLAPTDRPNWYSNWVERSLGLALPLSEVRDLYAQVMPRLAKAGLFEAFGVAKKQSYGLRPSALSVRPNPVLRACDTCGLEQAGVRGDALDLEGHPCQRYRCPGRMGALATDAATSRVRTYYQRFYARGAVGRVFASEHTGLLERRDREDLEIDFKERPRPDAANLLSCTPTLEMGIDIGDLSATMLCSVPRGASSYLQRIGRAGRATGNALVITFASTQPRDLYYFDDPLAMMAGAVRPPGCYLDAPEVLKRQALAFCFDAYARDGGTLPGRVREMLSAGEASAGFPAELLRYVETRRASLEEGFLRLFGFHHASTHTTAELSAFFRPSGETPAAIDQRLTLAIDETRTRREELRTRTKLLRERLNKVTEEPQPFDDPEAEKRELRRDLGFHAAELTKLLDQGVLQWLCDGSVLPNYAFPEVGVRLKAFVSPERPRGSPAGAPAGPAAGSAAGSAASAASSGPPDGSHYEWVRAPAVAIRELAPFNTFYGSARKVRIGAVDVGRRGAGVGAWQFCRDCHHAEPRTTEEVPAVCPRCGADRFSDSAQKHMLCEMREVFAFSRERDAVFSDESEQRERESYVTRVLYEVPHEAIIEAWSSEDTAFGFELVRPLRLRRINFGRTEPQADTSDLAGEPTPNVSFLVCRSCGQVQETRSGGRAGALTAHRPICPDRHKPERQWQMEPLHLYREVKTEAVRLLLPFSMHDAERKAANMRAALRVGLREAYGGDPDYLSIDTYSEPLRGLEEGRRHFLVLHDLVPGGTGQLADLVSRGGAKLREVLTAARKALLDCPCAERTPPVPACHLCLLGAGDGRDMALLERAQAVHLIDRLEEGFSGVARLERTSALRSIGQLEIAQVHESELEDRFAEAIRRWANQPPSRTLEELGKGVARITVGGRPWIMRPQVSVHQDQTSRPCRPDFTLYPEDGHTHLPSGEELLPIAIFADGYRYHVQPHLPRGRVHDDFDKRSALTETKNFLVWSLAWRDLDEYDRKLPELAPWVPVNVLDRLKVSLFGPLKLEGIASALEGDPLRALMLYLEHPSRALWTTLAAATMVGTLHGVGAKATEASAAVAHATVLERPSMGAPLALRVAGDGALIAAADLGPQRQARLLCSASAADVKHAHLRPEVLRVSLRLDDAHAQRADEAFMDAWRSFLRATNLLQFLPGFRVATTEQLGEDAEREVRASTLPRTYRTASGARNLAAAEMHRSSGRLAAVRGVLDPSAALLLRDVQDERHRQTLEGILLNGVALPVIPYELRKTEVSMVEVEIGWPEQRVALYTAEQASAAELLRRREGWQIFPIDDLDAPAVVRALTRKEAP